MTTKFYMTRDINGYNGFGVPFSDTNYGVKLAGTVAEYLTVPSDFPKYIAIFQYQPGSSVWVALNNTPAYSAGAMAATNSQFAPPAREVSAGDIIGLVTSDANATVGISFYAIP